MILKTYQGELISDVYNVTSTFSIDLPYLFINEDNIEYRTIMTIHRPNSTEDIGIVYKGITLNRTVQTEYNNHKFVYTITSEQDDRFIGTYELFSTPNCVCHDDGQIIIFKNNNIL